MPNLQKCHSLCAISEHTAPSKSATSIAHACTKARSHGCAHPRTHARPFRKGKRLTAFASLFSDFCFAEPGANCVLRRDSKIVEYLENNLSSCAFEMKKAFQGGTGFLKNIFTVAFISEGKKSCLLRNTLSVK